MLLCCGRRRGLVYAKGLAELCLLRLVCLHGGRRCLHPLALPLLLLLLLLLLLEQEMLLLLRQLLHVWVLPLHGLLYG